LTLSRLGSLFLTRPRLDHYVATHAELDQSTARNFQALAEGVVRPHSVTPFALEDAADAHRHLEDRAKTSIPILVP
jgi:NADPH2:quinone reductase